MKPVETRQAPQAIGPYSQGIAVGPFVFTSGQIPLDTNGNLVPGGIKEQTEQAIKNVEAVLKAAGTSLDQVAKTTVFLSNMDHFQEMNEVYARYFSAHKPARSAVEVSRLPKDVLVEIEAIAFRKEK